MTFGVNGWLEWQEEWRKMQKGHGKRRCAGEPIKVNVRKSCLSETKSASVEKVIRTTLFVFFSWADGLVEVISWRTEARSEAVKFDGENGLKKGA